MRSRELLLAVKEMLTEAMKEYPFPTPDGSCEDLQVFLHGLPDEQGRRTYPFICVRWVSGDINEGVDGYIGLSPKSSSWSFPSKRPSPTLKNSGWSTIWRLFSRNTSILSRPPRWAAL